jgi:hypothetical protein
MAWRSFWLRHSLHLAPSLPTAAGLGGVCGEELELEIALVTASHPRPSFNPFAFSRVLTLPPLSAQSKQASSLSLSLLELMRQQPGGAHGVASSLSLSSVRPSSLPACDGAWPPVHVADGTGLSAGEREEREETACLHTHAPIYAGSCRMTWRGTVGQRRQTGPADQGTASKWAPAPCTLSAANHARCVRILPSTMKKQSFTIHSAC